MKNEIGADWCPAVRGIQAEEYSAGGPAGKLAVGVDSECVVAGVRPRRYCPPILLNLAHHNFHECLSVQADGIGASKMALCPPLTGNDSSPFHAEPARPFRRCRRKRHDCGIFFSTVFRRGTRAVLPRSADITKLLTVGSICDQAAVARVRARLGSDPGLVAEESRHS